MTGKKTFLRKFDKRSPKKADEVLYILEQIYPKAQTALNFATPFELLVAVMLSAQCTDERVNKTTSRLFKKYHTPEDFARLNIETLADEIRSCGLYRNKSKNIIATSKILVEKYNSTVPNNLEELQKLPGVGRKTANVVLSVAFNQPTLAVDTHVFRVSQRLGLSTGKNPLQTEDELLEQIPPNMRRDAHHRIIYHGRKVCKARSPNCRECALQHLCTHVQP